MLRCCRKYRGAAPDRLGHLSRRTVKRRHDHPYVGFFDAGDMLAQQAVEIDPEETAGDLEARLAPLGAGMAMKVIDQMEQGPLAGAKQDKDFLPPKPRSSRKKTADRLVRLWPAFAGRFGRWLSAVADRLHLLASARKPPVRLMVTTTGKIIAASLRFVTADAWPPLGWRWHRHLGLHRQ